MREADLRYAERWHFQTEHAMATARPNAPSPAESADERLDEALDETFPASDPIAVDPTEPRRTNRPNPQPKPKPHKPA
jgi:hypothetical protein